MTFRFFSRSLGTLALLCVLISGGLAQTLLRGEVTDEKGEAIPFVRIGIVETRVALMSKFDGSFKLSVPQSLTNRRLTFQVPGFRTSSFAIDSLTQLSSVSIQLEEHITTLNKVTVTNKRLKTREIGNNGRRKGSDSDNGIKGDVHMAYATMVKGRKEPFRVKKLSVYIKNPYPEKYFLRPLVMEYDEKTGKPGKSLIRENLYFEIDQMNGWMDFDLDGYDITAEGTIVLGVEYLGSTRESAYFSISYDFGGGKNFKRVNTSDGFEATSESNWSLYQSHRKRPLIKAEIEY